MPSFRWGVTAAIAAFVISLGLGIISGVLFFHIILRGFIFAAVFFGIGFGLRFVIDAYFPEILVIGAESAAQEEYEQPGSRVNITLDSLGEYAVPELYKTPGDLEELGNIEDLISGIFSPRGEGVDRTKEEGYNNGKVKSVQDPGFIEFPEEDVYEKPKAQNQPVFSPSFGDDEGGLGGLPDLDAMAMAFSSAADGPRPAPQQWQSQETSSFAFGGDDDLGGLQELASVTPVATPMATTPTASAAPAFQPQQTQELEHVRTSLAGNKPQPLKGDFDPKSLAEGIRTVLSKD